MKEKAEAEKNEQEMKNLECKNVIQRDRQDLEQEKQKRCQRAKSLIRVTAKNKEVTKLTTYVNILLFYLFFLYS